MNSPRKLALITGATSGIGAAFARKLASQNYDLIVTGRRQDKINALAQELTSKNNINVEVVIAELADDKDLDILIQKTEGLKNLDILINNAGFIKRSAVMDSDRILCETMFKVNALVPILLTQAALKNMLPRNQGIIINVTSMGIFAPRANNAIYTSTKAFLRYVTEIAAIELKKTKVQIQLFCPGMTRTDIFERMGENIDQLAKQRGWLRQPMLPKHVVDISLRHLKKRKFICIPGIRNKIIFAMWALKQLSIIFS